MSTTCAVILAAGAGSRFIGDRHKLLAEIGGTPIVVHAARSCVDAGIGPVLVITGAEPGISPLVTEVGPRVRVAHNSRWAEGQATSLQRAVHAARELGADRIVVGLGDQAFITPTAWQRIAATDAEIAFATYEGRRGHPVLLHADVWPMLPTSGDSGARVVSSMRPDLVVEVPCEGSPIDIDTVEDLAPWQSSSSTNSPSTGRSRKPGR